MGQPILGAAMPSLTETLTELEREARDALAAAADLEALDAWRSAFLGRKGRLREVTRGLGSLPPEERRQVGALANRVLADLEAAYEERRRALEGEALARKLAQAAVDVSLPGRPLPRGRLHPVTQTLRDVLAAFQALGFQVVEGPEVEWDYYNFEALLIPKDHPARDLWATLWIDYRRDGEMPMLLRTHTSPNQVRYMEKHRPPIRIVSPGRCYRYEATDPTHEWMLTQVEVLAVDEGLSLADLKGTLAEVARRLFGTERRVRFRCEYYPFVEPGMDVLIDCFQCRGEGCRTCGQSGWIEVLGSGMVHPRILANVGYDPERYTGFAAGLGIERIAMLRYGIDDIRLFYQNDLRFLEQF